MATIPLLTSVEVHNITETTAISGGTITSNGNAAISLQGICWSTNSTPTIANSKTIDSTLAESFSYTITNLTANTTYYVRAFATNSAGTGYGNILSFKTNKANILADSIIFNPNISFGSMNDGEGNTYKTILIGTQTWMAENLKVTKYNNGSAIPLVTDDNTWSNLTTGAYCNYNNDETKVAVNGRLYNWYTIKDSILCPSGWHIPSENEWATLENYLILHGYNFDGTATTNKIAKSLASTHGWAQFSEIGTIGNDQSLNNSSGFTALPSGARNPNGSFDYMGYNAYWWSSTYGSSTNGDFTWLGAFEKNSGRSGYIMVYGGSVRCVKD